MFIVTITDTSGTDHIYAVSSDYRDAPNALQQALARDLQRMDGEPIDWTAGIVVRRAEAI